MPSELNANEGFYSLSQTGTVQLNSAVDRLIRSHLYDEPPISSIQFFCERYAISPKDFRYYCIMVCHCTPTELLYWARGIWMLKEIENNSSVKFIVLQIRLGYENSRGAFWAFQKRVYGRAGRKLKQELAQARAHLNARFAKLAEIVK